MRGRSTASREREGWRWLGRRLLLPLHWRVAAHTGYNSSCMQQRLLLVTLPQHATGTPWFGPDRGFASASAY